MYSQDPLHMVRLWKTLQVTLKNLDFKGQQWAATEGFWTAVWHDKRNYSTAAVFRVDWSQETQEVIAVVQAWSKKRDSIVSMVTERERYGNYFEGRNNRTWLLIGYECMEEAAVINDSGVLSLESCKNKSEIGTLIRRAALRGKIEFGLRHVELHIMMQCISGNALHKLKRASLGHSPFSFFFFLPFFPLFLLPLHNFDCIWGFFSKAFRNNFATFLTFSKLWRRLPSLSPSTLSSR